MRHAIAISGLMLVTAITCFGFTAQTLQTSKETKSGIVTFHGRRPKKAKSGDVWINPKDDAELIYITAGKFLMGDKDQRDNKPRQIFLDGYWMYKNLVTVKMYKKFCNECGHALPFKPGWGLIDDHPVVNITAMEAERYCKWAGVRLPSEREWEKAAAWDYKSNRKLRFPWGDKFDASKLWSSVDSQKNRTNPAGDIHTCKSPYGLLDMAGNVWQWTSSKYGGGNAANASDRVMRGGTFISSRIDEFRSAYRDSVDQDVSFFLVGFRGATGP